MAKSMKWVLTKTEQKKYTTAMTKELTLLRAKIGISQADLSNAIGISRQTYSAVESGSRDMSWNTFLSLICFYDHIAVTRQMLREAKVFPAEIFARFNDGRDADEAIVRSIAGIPASIVEHLDDSAFHVIRTVVMMEYARCMKLPSEEIIRAFDGVSFAPVGVDQEAEMVDAIHKLKG